MVTDVAGDEELLYEKIKLNERNVLIDICEQPIDR